MHAIPFEEKSSGRLLTIPAPEPLANLVERFAAETKKRGFPVFFPSPGLSTDNAAMIAAAGYSRLMAGCHADTTLNASAALALGTSARQNNEQED